MFKSIQISSGPVKQAPIVTGVFSNEISQGRPAGKSPERKKGARTRPTSPGPGAGLGGVPAAPGFKAEAGETFVMPSGNLLLGLGRALHEHGLEAVLGKLLIAGQRTGPVSQRMRLRRLHVASGGQGLRERFRSRRCQYRCGAANHSWLHFRSFRACFTSRMHPSGTTRHQQIAKSCVSREASRMPRGHVSRHRQFFEYRNGPAETL